MCDLGDAVCDYDADAEEVTPAAIAIHTSYAVGTSAGYAWTTPVYQLLGPAPTAHQVPVPELDARAINSTTTPAGSSSAASTTTMASTAPAGDIPAR